MKKPVSHSKHAVPPEKLAEAILELLRIEPRTSDDLVRLTGYTGDVVRRRLADLRSVGSAHRKSQRRVGWGGMQFVWRVGSDAGALPSPMTVREKGGKSIAEPHQATVRHYPTFHYRDPLVSALFGHAGKEAA